MYLQGLLLVVPILRPRHRDVHLFDGLLIPVTGRDARRGPEEDVGPWSTEILPREDGVDRDGSLGVRYTSEGRHEDTTADGRTRSVRGGRVGGRSDVERPSPWVPTNRPLPPSVGTGPFLLP